MLTSRKILLVDDDPKHLLICAHILEKAGYEVKSVNICQDLDELLSIVRTYNPGLIFMDHRMPQISGFQAIQLLKTNALTKRIPVIYFSAEEDIAELSEKSGADSFLRKPFDLDKLTMVASLHF